MISHGGVVYELQLFQESWRFFLDVCFACFSQMLNLWIDDVGVSLTVICIRFLEVCLSYC